jgi:hypothetical protein
MMDFVFVDGTHSENRMEAEQINESVLLANVNQVHPAQSKTGSIIEDCWSEISAVAFSLKSFTPLRELDAQSLKSSKPNQPDNADAVFAGTYLQHSSLMPGISQNFDVCDDGFFIIDAESAADDDHSVHCSSNSASVSSNHQQCSDVVGTRNKATNDTVQSLASSASQVPFSWAEVTKIQPLFHRNQCHQSEQCNVFEPKQPIKALNKIQSAPVSGHTQPQSFANNAKKRSKHGVNADDQYLAYIPEADPFATKSDLGRHPRRVSKRRSRLRYPSDKKQRSKISQKRNNK